LGTNPPDRVRQGDTFPQAAATEDAPPEAGPGVDAVDGEGEPLAGKKDRETSLSEQPAYGFWVVLAGIAVIGAMFVGALIKWNTARDVVTTMGVVTGAVSALVAAFFGVRAGTYAQSKDVEREKHRDRMRRDQRTNSSRSRNRGDSGSK
jgi:hypothetical protein